MSTYSHTALKGFFPDYNPDLTPEQALTPLSESWQSLIKALIDAQDDGPEGCEVKLLLTVRHCQGGHNAMCDLHIPKDHCLSPKEHRLKMREIGRQYPLFDPGLSAKGEEQGVQLTSSVYKVLEQRMPVPEHFSVPQRGRYRPGGGSGTTKLLGRARSMIRHSSSRDSGRLALARTMPDYVDDLDCKTKITTMIDSGLTFMTKKEFGGE